MDEGSGDGGFLLHAGRELVAPAVAEAVHVEAAEDFVDAVVERCFVEPIEPAEVLHDLLGGEPRVQSGGGREEADARAHLFGLLDDIVAADQGCAVGRLEDGREHAESGGLAGAISSQQSVDLARLASETHALDCANLAALFVLEALGQTTGFNHRDPPLNGFLSETGKCRPSVLRKRRAPNYRTVTDRNAARPRAAGQEKRQSRGAWHALDGSVRKPQKRHIRKRDSRIFIVGILGLATQGYSAVFRGILRGDLRRGGALRVMRSGQVPNSSGVSGDPVAKLVGLDRRRGACWCRPELARRMRTAIHG